VVAVRVPGLTKHADAHAEPFVGGGSCSARPCSMRSSTIRSTTLSGPDAGCVSPGAAGRARMEAFIRRAAW
jgi:hypothetical protein